MPFADLGEFRMYYEDHGQGPPVVMLHGFSLDRRLWRPNLPSLIPHYRVILPDARGHGLSDAPVSGYSRDHRVEDLRGLVDHLGLESFHLVGLSMGGATGIGFALKYQPRLRSLTLVSTGAAGYSVGKRFSRLDELARREGVAAAKQRWMEWALAWYRHRHQDVGRFIRTMMEEHSGAVWIDPMRGKYPRTVDLERVHEIRVPVLIMAGTEDKVFLPLARLLAERIPHARRVEFEHTGHIINLEQPERFNEELKSFLDAAEARRAFSESV